jgi:RNA polymerase sigma-70 factor (ECF subfamily)
MRRLQGEELEVESMRCLARHYDCRYDFGLTLAGRLAGRLGNFKARSETRSVKPESSDPDEIELLRGVAQGDRAAFAQLYDQFAGILYATALKILQDAREAEDVLQDVFLQIWDKAKNYDPNLGKPLTWTLTLTRHKAIDRLRSAQRRYKLAEEAAPELAQNQAQSSEAFNADQNSIIRAAVKSLPSDQRQAIELAYFGGLTQDEISKHLQQPLGTIKARIRRGLMKLRDSLEGRL